MNTKWTSIFMHCEYISMNYRINYAPFIRFKFLFFFVVPAYTIIINFRRKSNTVKIALKFGTRSKRRRLYSCSWVRRRVFYGRPLAFHWLWMCAVWGVPPACMYSYDLFVCAHSLHPCSAHIVAFHTNQRWSVSVYSCVIARVCESNT